MYLCKASGLIGYETFEELLDAILTVVAENDDYYFIKVKSWDVFDNGMYMVDKVTLELTYIYFTEYICKYEHNDDTKELDPEEFKKRFKRS